MEYVIGLISGLVLFVVVGFAFYAGYRIGKQRPPDTKETLDAEARRKLAEFQEGFQSIMRYDVAQAQQRKKVI